MKCTDHMKKKDIEHEKKEMKCPFSVGSKRNEMPIFCRFNCTISTHHTIIRYYHSKVKRVIDNYVLKAEQSTWNLNANRQ